MSTVLRASDPRFLGDEKHEYRIAVWSTIVSRIERPEKAHALILPADNGAEIPIMIHRGFREEHIHAVDDNPAMLEALARDPGSWRNRYPAVNIYGNRLPRACERIRDSGVRLTAANFDLCGNLSDPVYRDIKESFATGVLADYAVVGLTMLRGREPATTLALLNRVGRSRTGFVLEEAKGHRSLHIIREEQYQNGSPMVWSVAVTRSPMRIDLESPRCPRCGVPMWDNRPRKSSGVFDGNAPDFQCQAIVEHHFWLIGD